MDTPAESTFHVWVKALPENGFHRAGRFWPSEWSEADVTAMQLATLEGEKHLAVRRINPEEISAVQAIQMEHTRSLSDLDEARARIATLEPLAAGAEASILQLSVANTKLEAENNMLAADLAAANKQIASLESLLSDLTKPEKAEKATKSA